MHHLTLLFSLSSTQKNLFKNTLEIHAYSAKSPKITTESTNMPSDRKARISGLAGTVPSVWPWEIWVRDYDVVSRGYITDHVTKRPGRLWGDRKLEFETSFTFNSLIWQDQVTRSSPITCNLLSLRTNPPQNSTAGLCLRPCHICCVLDTGDILPRLYPNSGWHCAVWP